MGKQKSGVTYISQEKFDKELNSSVDILIADGADDNTIKEYISDYKSRFAVGEKKNSVSTTTSTKAPSASPAQQTKAKSLSVGGKPLQTGASASSAGKGKPTQEYELKPIKEERYEKFYEKDASGKLVPKTKKVLKEVYEKDASGKLVPKMEKVLKGYASSTEEREIVREEVKQKALKPLSNSVTLQSYKESTKPTEQEINDAVIEIDDKINQKGFGNGVSTGLKKGANFLSDMFTTIGTLGIETKGPNFDLNPYAKEEEQAKKELTKEFKGDTSKFSSEDILARTKQIALDKKIEDIQISKNNDFLSNLSEKDKRDLELEKIANYKTISAKDKYLTTEATILVNDTEKDARDYNVVKSIVLNNNKKGIETSKELMDYGLQLENNLKEAQLKAEDLENSISTNRAEIGSIEEEIDFIKRNYSLKDKFITNMKLGFGDLYLNIGDRQELMMGDLFGTIEEDRKREIVDKLIDWEEAKGVYRGDLSKDVSFENLKLSNAGEFFFQELGTQVPTFVQIAMPGGVTSSGLTSSFDKYSQMVLEESKNPEVAYSKLQKLTTAIGFGTSEALLGALPTKGILSRSFKSFENAGKRSLFFESGKNYIKRKGIDVIESASMESVTEGLTQVIQNVLDKTVLGKKDVGILDNVGHASFSGGMLGGAMTVAPTIAGVISRPFSDNKQRVEVSNNLKSIFNLQEQLDNQSIDDVSKKVIKDKISELESKNDDIFKSLAKKTKDMPEDIFNAIVDVVKQQELLSSKAASINSDPNIDVNLKEQLIKDLKGKFDALEAKRSLLISEDVTSFDALSDEEQTKLKEKATNILKKEELDKGVDEVNINISPEVINKKAKELYNQKIQEDAKRKQTDGQITSEEKPTTATEEQTVSTTQQVDAGVQTQEEVEIPKIQEDAVQEQTTSEIPVQPETAVSEEVEQGEPEAKPEESTEQGEEKVKPLKEVKSQLQELFNVAKEAISITKNRAKEIDKLKKDLNQFVKSNLVGLDASDIMKSAYQKITSLVQNTTDVNFEGQAEKINDIIDELYLRRELKDEVILDKKIKEASKDTFYKDKTSGKVTKTKVTDEFKKKIEEVKENFAKIKNPTIADKTVFYLEVNKLLKDGIKARKAINEARDSKSRENANRLAIISLNKNKSIEPKRTVSMSDGIIDKIFDKFSGGVIFNGKIYLNTKSGKSNFITDTEGLSRVSFNPISTSNVASSAEANRKGFKTAFNDIRRRYSTATFSANKFFEPLFSVEGAKEFLDKNWINRLKVYSEKLGRKVSEFRDVRDNFIKDVIGKENFLNNNRILKSNTYDVIKTAVAIFKGGDKSSPLWAFVGRNEIQFSIDVNGKKVEGDYLGIVDELDLMIKEDPSIKKFKDQFVSRYIPFDKMKNEGVAALFNMLRQPEGLNKFLNSYSIEDAKAIISYVNENPGIREVADKSTKLFENIRDYVNPTLDKLGYDTLGEAKYVSKEDALKIKDDKSTRDLYEILDMVYPDGLPEKIPYYPLSAESLSGTNEGNVLEFFEDSENPNADYSLLFPSLFTRTSGGNLNLNNLSVTRSFDDIAKEAITLVQGSDIVSDVRNLYANEGNNVAMISAFGKSWNDKFKTKILNIVRDDAYNTSMGSKDLVSSASRFWVASRSTLRAAQLALNAFSAISQLTGIPIAYAKEGNLKYLKDTLKNLAKKETRNKEFNELKEAYNAIINSKNYIERTNKRKDNAEVAAIQSINDNLGYRVSGALISDLLIFTTVFDQISVIALTPLYKGKYQTDTQTTTTENVDEFFAEEVNKTLQSNAPFYTGTAFYQKWALALGLGGYLQSPRQIMEMISSDVNSMLRKDGDYASKMKRIIAMSSFGLILPIMIKEALRGGDDEEEESKADKKTSMLQFGNKIIDSVLESMGFAGTLVSSVKNAALIKYSPDVMEMDVNPSDLKSQDIVMQALKGASPNISITMRGIDNVIDKKEIYTNTDQFLFALETGTGFAGAKLKKNIDYVVAAGSESYDYKDYWSLVTGRVTQDEFKQYEKELNTFRETLDKAVYPRLTPNKTLNTSFLNEKQMNELSKMGFEQKAEYIEDIRLNLMRKSIVEQIEFLKKLGGMDKTKGYYKVRESKIKEELSEDAFKLLENKYYSGENLMTVEELTDKLDEFTKEEGISEETSLSILKEAIKKANDKIDEKFILPAIKKLDKVSKGRDRAKYIYDNVGDLMEGDNIKYIEMMGDDFDESTSDEYFEIIRKKQNNK